MNKNDQQTVMAMIAAMQAQLDAMRTVLYKEELEYLECQHDDMITVQTMSGIQGGFCNDCGAEFGMGVLDKDENNE